MTDSWYKMRVSCPLPADWSVRAELRPKALAKSSVVRKSPRLPSTGTGRHVAAAREKVESTQRGSHPQFRETTRFCKRGEKNNSNREQGH